MRLEQTTEDGAWHEQFAHERARLIGALSALTEGGIVESVEHIGATSVPGLLGRPCVDIALQVWPFPLDDAAKDKLAGLGYEPDPDVAGAAGQQFHHASAPFQLYVVDSGEAQWADLLLVRDHLRHDPAARRALSDRKRAWEDASDGPEYREAKRAWLDQLVGEARRSWIAREGFAPVQRVAEELRELAVAWYIGGGWALDLFLRRVTRVHHDADVVVPRADQLTLQRYLTERGWIMLTPFEQRLQPWPPHMRLEAPRFQAHAHRDGAFMDFLLTDMDHGVWRYRRNPAILRELGRAVLCSEDGIPYLAPELALLFKSSTSSGKERDKDQADFEAVSDVLEPERRAWLRWALTALNPAHRWLDRL